MKEIDWLKAKIEELSQKEFDLEAWRTSCVLFLESVFGPDSKKVKMMEKLDYEYNSWSLRDSSGIESSLSSCKNQGKVILNAAIQELEVFGLPSVKGFKDSEIIDPALRDSLSGKDYKKLLAIISSDDKREEKEEQLKAIFHLLPANIPLEILLAMVLNPSFKPE